MAVKGQGDRNRDGMKDDLEYNVSYSSHFQNHGNLSYTQKRMKINKDRMSGTKLNTSKINETHYREGEII